MDRLGFFKQGLSSMLDVASSIVGLKHAANSFVEVVDEALSNIKTDIGLHLPSLDAGMYDDPQGTLSEVAHIGYTMVEVGAYYGGKIHNMAPEEFKALVNKAGLKITSAHINHLHQSAEDSTAGTFANSADAEAAKRAARWAAMASGAVEEEATEEGATAEGTAAKEAAAEGATAEEGIAKEVVAEEVAEEGAKVKGTEKTEGTEDTTAEDAEAKPDPNDEWWREALDIHKELGCRYIVMSRLPDYPTDEVIAESDMLCDTNMGVLSLDAVEFNNNMYLTAIYDTFFTWSTAGGVLYDISTVGTFNQIASLNLGDMTAKANGSGLMDVVMTVSENGVYMYVYAMFTNGAVGCIRYDCLKNAPEE